MRPLNPPQCSIDALKQNINQLKAGDATDRLRLEQHFTSIDDLKFSVENYPIPGENCAPLLLGGSSTGKAIPEVKPIDIIVSALACDLTRVSSLRPRAIQTWPFSMGFPLQKGGTMPFMQGRTEANRLRLRATYRWFMEQFAYLLERLKSVPEGDGTLLDNTLVLYANIMSAGNHSADKKCYLLAGGKNLGLTGGRHLSFNGHHHGALHTSILNLFGYEDRYFGNKDTGPEGPLPGLLS